MPTSKPPSCAPSGVGDDSGIVLPSNTSDVADSDLGSRAVERCRRRTLVTRAGVPWTDGLPSEVPASRASAIVTELPVAMRAIEISDRRSEARSTCGAREVEGVL